MSIAEQVLLSGIVLVGYTVHAVTGFGSVITCLVLASWWFDFSEVQPSFVALSLMLNLVFITRDYRWVSPRLVLGQVLPWLGVGVLGGFAVSGAIEGPGLRQLFGVFVVLLSARELYRIWAAPAGAEVPAGKLRRGWLLAAGGIHGIYATGGPMTVYALSGLRLSKTELRASLCAVQSVVNTGLLIGYTRREQLGQEGWVLVASLVPALVAALVLGSWIHGRVDGERLRVGVFLLLLLAALGMVLR